MGTVFPHFVCYMWVAAECEVARFMGVVVCMIGAGNGLVPLGNKPLPEPMLTLTNVTI